MIRLAARLYYHLPARLAAVLLALALTAAAHGPASAGQSPPRQNFTANTASYTIAVELDASLRQLNGQQTITYTNNTSIPIPDLVFHLYLNAFANAETLFMRESGGAGRGADRALDRLSVTMANTYGQGHPWLDCHQLKQVARGLADARGSAPLVEAADQLLEARGTPQFAWLRR